MRPSATVFAKVSQRTIKPLPPNLQVLAPLVLYRRLLRAHRKYLPPAARLIGDDYVKAEFRRTKDTENPVHIIGFLSQWQVSSWDEMCSLQQYCQQVEGEHWKEPKVDTDLLEKMSDEQIGQVTLESGISNGRCMSSCKR
jgi:hypothetical protein